MKKKIIIFTLLSVLIVTICLFYWGRLGHSKEYASNCAHTIVSILNRIINEEEIYEKIDSNFVISSLDDCSDNSDIINAIKEKLDSELKNYYKENDSIKSLHPEKYQYYIEIRDKKIDMVVCSRFNHCTYVGSFLNRYKEERYNFSEVAHELFSNF